MQQLKIKQDESTRWHFTNNNFKQRKKRSKGYK